MDIDRRGQLSVNNFGGGLVSYVGAPDPRQRRSLLTIDFRCIQCVPCSFWRRVPWPLDA
jgi:hypothetical protein